MKKIGVLRGHGEVLVPEADGFSVFFGLIEGERAVVEAIGDQDARSGLVGWDALLVGGPVECLPEATIAALRAWVWAGGRLLLAGGAGGDHPPLVGREGRTNLSRVIEGLTFGDDVVHWESEMEAGENLVVRVDLEPLGPHRRGQWFDFVSGCTIELAPHHPVISALHAGRDGLAWRSLHPCFDEIDRLTIREGGEALPTRALVFAEFSAGLGRVLALGSTGSFHDQFVRLKRHGEPADGHRSFLEHLLRRWVHDSASGELARRMKEPQRHRLLQGYPMLKLMEPQDELLDHERRPFVPRRWPAPPPAVSWSDRLWPGQHRPCLVGVLPHPFCNPTVRGCGFCTFPQEKLARDRMPALLEAVRGDIAAFWQDSLGGGRAAIPALYFGGATANLTPAAGLEAICRELSRAFETRGAEVTLEGVPRYFALDDFRLMRAMTAAFPEATPRISMGVQTFDRAQIARMGRAGFGDRPEIEGLVPAAHGLGFSVSCDLLINLPGQTLPQMLEDLTIAAEAGFDQICLYHLVLFEGLGTPWSEDRSLLALLRGNEQSFANYRLCRKRLYEIGFTQTTLTHFERRASGRPRFRYEPLGFQPDRHDLLGFGPAAISLATSRNLRSGWKVVKEQLSDRYLAGGQRRFLFDEIDMKLLFLTRSIAALGVDSARYQEVFGTDVRRDFPEEIAALLDRGLLRERPGQLALSPEGMFFADSVAGLLAWRRVQVLRDPLDPPPPSRPGPGPYLRFRDPNLSSYGSMG
jgi:oxygen-independent coproporphyrinogen-3 oxidase